MAPTDSVAMADRASRKRAILIAAATLVFLVIQVAARPVFVEGPAEEFRVRGYFWALNAGALMILLGTGGGLAQRREIRALVDDQVSASHRISAVAIGFWIAMTLALVVYLLPGLRDLTSREAVYTIVTPSISAALLAFSWLELRAHRDA
jgi:hypothetical protein